jgi:hypothetical protein
MHSIVIIMLTSLKLQLFTSEDGQQGLESDCRSIPEFRIMRIHTACLIAARCFHVRKFTFFLSFRGTGWEAVEVLVCT